MIFTESSSFKILRLPGSKVVDRGVLFFLFCLGFFSSVEAAEQKEEGEGAMHCAAGQAAGGGEEAAGARAEGPTPPQAGEGQLVTRQ